MTALFVIDKYYVSDVYDFLTLVFSKKKEWLTGLKKLIEIYASEEQDQVTQVTKEFFMELKKIFDDLELQKLSDKDVLNYIFRLEKKYISLTDVIDSDEDFIVDTLDLTKGNYAVEYDPDADEFIILELELGNSTTTTTNTNTNKDSDEDNLLDISIFSQTFGEIPLKKDAKEKKVLVLIGDVIHHERDGYLPDPQDLKLNNWGEWEEELVKDVVMELEGRGYKVKKTYYDEDLSDEMKDDVYVIEYE